MACDEAILADHHGQVNSRIFRNRICLNIVVVNLLVVFRVDLNPAGISRAHAVGMIAVDVDRTGKRAVHQGQNDGQPVGCR